MARCAAALIFHCRATRSSMSTMRRVFPPRNIRRVRFARPGRSSAHAPEDAQYARSSLHGRRAISMGKRELLFPALEPSPRACSHLACLGSDGRGIALLLWRRHHGAPCREEQNRQNDGRDDHDWELR